MKKSIHPDYHEATFICACGETFKGKTTQKGSEIRLDVCSACHPFFSGQQKLVDTSGRVDKFVKKHNLDNK